ncbi:Helicase protein MOM1 [Forsythia ovata]|uniref:Helicase protein MOM1 n=1 Tax=Forsythia ovata TaxID=205694 RepID=A0ABD1VK18_9LAMI
MLASMLKLIDNRHISLLLFVVSQQPPHFPPSPAARDIPPSPAAAVGHRSLSSRNIPSSPEAAAGRRSLARVAPSKKHAAVNHFNKKESGQFVFLLENRACSSSIKLSSVDIVIIYDSEWNPANDLKALQKLSFDSKFEQIKVFRLYSSCTVEEKALLLAKQVLNLDNNMQNLSRTTSDTLLMWGASYLFSKLDDYHADSSPTSASNISSEQLLLNDTTNELLSILSESYENNGSGCIISKVQLGVGHYSINLPLLGEGKFQLKDGEEAHVF